MFRKLRVRSALLSALAVLPLLLTSVNAAGASSAVKSTFLPCDPVKDFKSSNFTNPTKIDNQWLPLIPGSQFFLEGTINTDTGPVPHRVIFTVSDVTKVINGVRTRVMWDRDINDGELVERELAFFAQDKDGNVWNLGEYPEEFDAGAFAGAPSTWIAGKLHALGGVHMLAKPQVGTPEYLQGYAPTIDFLDCAQVFATGQHVSEPAGNFNNVLVTEETSPLVVDGGSQLKYHAKNVGIVQIGDQNDPEAEILALVKIKHLGPDALARVRDRVCKLDNRGYKFGGPYRNTAPALQSNGQPCTAAEANEAEAKANIAADAAEW